MFPRFSTVVALVLLSVVTGCTETRPFRTALPATPSSISPTCPTLYTAAGDYPAPVPIANPKNPKLAVDAPDTDIDFEHHAPVDASSQCWTSAWEHHKDYDLLFAEFDDQGWENRGNGSASRIPALITKLNELMANSGHPQPLNIVVFVHGWHHSAEAVDNNVKQFRFILGRTAEIETDLSKQRAGASTYAWQAPRRVVGIYVGWRGDSVRPFLGLDNTSIWDRKLAAENVSGGSVSVLFAALHNFYAQNSCRDKASALQLLKQRQVHRITPVTSDKNVEESSKAASLATAANALSTCTDVRMLVLGHSFGGLIVYRSLSSRLVASTVETYRPNEIAGETYAAVGYGDLVMLINPAFEAARFESLAQGAASRPYPSPSSTPGAMGQLPIVIVVQSDGDTATGTFFPIFRNVTTIFDDTPSDGEALANTHTVGWDSRYVTHDLVPGGGFTKCDDSDRLSCEKLWWQDQRTSGYAAFGANLPLPDGLSIGPSGLATREIQRPPFDPVWVVRSSAAVIGDHDDLLNIKFIRFVRQMYYTVLHEEDCQLIEAAQGDSPDAGCPKPQVAVLSSR